MNKKHYFYLERMTGDHSRFKDKVRQGKARQGENRQGDTYMHDLTYIYIYISYISYIIYHIDSIAKICDVLH